MLTVDSGLLPAVTMDNVWTRLGLFKPKTKHNLLDFRSMATNAPVTQATVERLAKWISMSVRSRRSHAKMEELVWT